MRILLINPPVTSPTKVPGLNSTWREHDYAPPLGLMAISAWVKKAGHTDVGFLNGQTIDGLDDAAVVRELRESPPGLVGITASTLFLWDVLRMAKLVKTACPSTRIVLGGPHLTEYAAESVQHPEVDFGVVGEGEVPFLALADALENGTDFTSIKGLIYKRDDGTVAVNPPDHNVLPMDELPLPDYTLVDLSTYHIPYDHHHPSGIMVTSRGCPFKCTFCSLNYPYFRTMSAEGVVNEMEALKRLGCRAITFNDDNFNVSRKRVIQICDLIMKRHLDIPWSFRGRVDCVDEELIRKVAEAGCIRIHFGVESGTQEMLDATKKGITLDQARTAFDLCRKYRIMTVAFFMIGLPGETIEQARKSVDFALELKPEYVVFTSLIPQPGSAIYDQALAAGAFPDYLREFAKNPVADFTWKTWDTAMTREEVNGLMRSAFIRFYLRPGYILHRLGTLEGLKDLGLKITSGSKLIWQLVRG